MTLGQPVLFPVAFQVWDLVGWLGQGLFTLRFLHQWIRSERAGRSHVTQSFWWTSLLATLLLIVYTLHRKDPVFIVGFLVNGFLYARNLTLARRADDTTRRGSPLWPVLAGLAVFGVVTVVSLLQDSRIVSFDHPLLWLAVGFLGQALWSSRFLVQWYVSERLGRSVLPPAFFWMSLLGAPFLFGWAVYRLDWVMMAAFALNPIPYARNLVLLRRERKGAAPTPARLPALLDAWRDPLAPRPARGVGTLVFTALVLFVALYDLGSRSLHDLDLPRFGVLAREMIRSGEWLVPTRFGEIYANKPPLTIWLIAGPAAIVGEVTPLLVRLPCALGYVLAVFGTLLWARARLSDTSTLSAARTAALLTLGTWLMLRLGRESRPDMLGAGLATMAAALIDRAALGNGRRGDPWWAGVFLGLALLTKGPPLLLVPALVLVLPSAGRSVRERLRTARPLVVIAVALGVVALWLIPAWRHGGTGYVQQLVLDQATTRVAGTSSHVEPIWYYAVRILDAAIPWTPLFLLALVLVFTRAGRRLLGPASPCVWAAVATFLFLSAVPTKNIRYLAPIVPLLAIAGARLIADVSARSAAPRWTRTLRVSGWALVVLAPLLALGALKIPDAFVPMLAPAALVFLLGLAALQPATAPDVARRRVFGTVLVLVALLGAAYWVGRPRTRVREWDAFGHSVQAVVEVGVPFYTVGRVRPDDVYHAVPEARHRRSAEFTPDAGRFYVLVGREHHQAVMDRLGREGRVILEHRFTRYLGQVVLLAFDAE